METKAINRFSTQQYMAVEFVLLISVFLNQSELLSLHPVAAFRLYVCSYNPQSITSMSPVK